MPSAGVERPVEIGDEAVLPKIDLDFPEELGENDGPNLYCGEAAGPGVFGV